VASSTIGFSNGPRNIFSGSCANDVFLREFSFGAAITDAPNFFRLDFFNEQIIVGHLLPNAIGEAVPFLDF